MDTDGFWRVIESSDSPAALHQHLTGLSQADLADFEVLHQQAFVDSYTWELWGAAYVIESGCSDDGFDYFRAYLISRGRRVFESALADPDSLADVELDDSEVWEDWMSPTIAVVHARTGDYDYAAPDRLPVMPEEPAGSDWDDDDLPERLPNLWARYT